jgi:hypothetical protein
MERCKSLARIIKAGRAPAWPCPPTPDLPTKEVADALLDNYLRTSESIYRILHMPSFRKDYDGLWESNNPPGMAFMVQLKLVLAIGAITYDGSFSLRPSAMRWVYEAQTWLSEPKFKSRLDIKTLQTNLLLLIAQEGVGVRGDNMWISMGALLRKTIFMGLHKDPMSLQPMTVLAQEMRRRLWNTILELALQSSLTSGGPPLISLDDFTTVAPQNFDDEQLSVDQAVPRAENERTQVSIAIALRKTFPQRLALVKFLNDSRPSGTYEETLRIDADLRASYQSLRQSLQSDPQELPTQLEMSMLDFLLHRYMVALHVPFFTPAMQETAYMYSRKVVERSCLKIWRAICPDASALTDDSTNEWTGVSRLAICSSGFYPSVAIHAVFLLALELRAQILEDDGLGSTPLRPDLISVLDQSSAWAAKTLQAGETSVKGCAVIRLLACHVDALRKGLSPSEITGLLTDALENEMNESLVVLEQVAARYGYGDADIELEQVPMTPSEAIEDWDFMVCL